MEWNQVLLNFIKDYHTFLMILVTQKQKIFKKDVNFIPS